MRPDDVLEQQERRALALDVDQPVRPAGTWTNPRRSWCSPVRRSSSTARFTLSDASSGNGR